MLLLKPRSFDLRKDPYSIIMDSMAVKPVVTPDRKYAKYKVLLRFWVIAEMIQ